MFLKWDDRDNPVFSSEPWQGRKEHVNCMLSLWIFTVSLRLPSVTCVTPIFHFCCSLKAVGEGFFLCPYASRLSPPTFLFQESDVVRLCCVYHPLLHLHPSLSRKTVGSWAEGDGCGKVEKVGVSKHAGGLCPCEYFQKACMLELVWSIHCVNFIYTVKFVCVCMWRGVWVGNIVQWAAHIRACLGSWV